ncbi:virulence factor SrfC family protein [Pelagibius sp. Alg239-R121]|uniref:virulence factor SrfC family protein n=1 Tax=Pelagibius sp. Alg239-R121 TaxID=2993448 RepID=UPI0024A61E69|nr:virulence factor SrfC family protein [Pelagibius sp. Alg239-R121]
MSEQDLKTRCLLAADTARAALAWITDPENAEVVGTERKLLAKELRRDERRARQLAEAAQRPMSIGVYGPSQAGKSYLVSVLAKPSEGRLIAAVGEGMDFIEEINPEGDKEATGLVTRFTMRPETCPPGYPVTLKILSEADVIRIIANTFFRDGDNSEPPPAADEIARRLEVARAAAGQDTGSGLSEADVWDIQSYFENNFRGLGYAQELAAFWEDAAELLPRLNVAARRPLLALLWGDYEVFSELYEQLAEALNRLGYAEKAYAGIESLTPRNTSIIDVATLFGLDGIGDVSDIRLRTESGIEQSLPRQVVAALTAELVLPMKDQPWDIFEEADLLDFPGVRERRTAKGPLTGYIDRSEAPRKELFLRGKVGFLFDRYVAQQDLTAMLLCVPPSNVNVAADLSLGVEEWIARTQGATADERAKVDTLLFLVLTMFDRHLADPAGSLDPHQRFENRLEASLIAPFGGLKESWPLNWTPSKPFENTFWLRNPNFPAEHVIKYVDGVEVEVHDHKVARIAELKAGCLSSDLVKRHFTNPDTAWEAAMTLKDGGVRYLVDSLTPVATREVKERQIDARLRELGDKIARRLKPLYSDSDIAKRLAARRAVATAVLRELRTAFDNRRFGRVIEEFGIPANSLTWRIERIPENVQIVSGDVEPEDDFDWMPDDFDVGMDDAPEAPASGNEVRTMTQAQFQAETAVEAWQEHIRALSERPNIDVQINLSPSSAAELANELMGAARRLRLAEAMTAELKPWNERQCGASTVAALSALRINQMVSTLGVDLMSAEERPVMKNTKTGESRLVFEPEPTRYDAMDLPDVSPRRNRIYFQDWTFTLYRLFEDNARSEDGAMINIEQNSRLGVMIEGLESLG